MRAGAVLLLLSTVLALASACTAVRPWERDELAKPEMAWDPDPIEAAQRGHIFFSKEGSLPGGGAGGGGCGCN